MLNDGCWVVADFPPAFPPQLPGQPHMTQRGTGQNGECPWRTSTSHGLRIICATPPLSVIVSLSLSLGSKLLWGPFFILSLVTGGGLWTSLSRRPGACTRAPALSLLQSERTHRGLHPWSSAQQVAWDWGHLGGEGTKAGSKWPMWN